MNDELLKEIAAALAVNNQLLQTLIEQNVRLGAPVSPKSHTQLQQAHAYWLEQAQILARTIP